jgi:hypothetical protein
MKKILLACICTSLLLTIPFTSMAVSPTPLVPEHPKVAPTPNDDPDGPYAGGLDDPTDWINLLSFVGNLLLIPGYVLVLLDIISERQGPQALPSFIWYLLLIYWGLRYGAFDGFTDAFDLRDPDEDGR